MSYIIRVRLSYTSIWAAVVEAGGAVSPCCNLPPWSFRTMERAEEVVRLLRARACYERVWIEKI